MSDELRPGSIITYPYLWRWQSERGETEGRKERPVCVVIVVVGADGLTHLALLAISSRPPTASEVALEVPEIERRRAGLSDFRKAWVTVGEYNYDVAERSFFLEPGLPVLGQFGRAFMRKIAMAAAPLFAARQGRVDRTS